MFNSKHFNKTSDGNDIKFPRLKPNQQARYKLLSIRPDPDNEGKFLIPASRNVPSTSFIMYGEGDDAEAINIACIERVHHDGRIDLKPINFQKRGMGQIILKGSNPSDQVMYGYLEMCNSNISNPNRNSEAKKIFYRVDEEKQAVDVNKSMDLLSDALASVRGMSADELGFLAISLGANPTSSNDVCKALVYKEAKESPKTLLALIKAGSYRLEAMAREAVKLGVITNKTDINTFVWTKSEEPIYKYEIEVGQATYHKFAKFLAKEHKIANAIQVELAAVKEK